MVVHGFSQAVYYIRSTAFLSSSIFTYSTTINISKYRKAYYDRSGTIWAIVMKGLFSVVA